MSTAARAVPVLVAALVIGSLPGVQLAKAAVGHSPSRHLAVVGFQQGGDSPALIAQDAAALRTVGVDGVNLSAHGRSTTSVPAGSRANRREAHREHLRAELLFGNWTNKINDFSEPLAHRMLAHRANRDAVARRLARIVRHQHWDGISLDLEALRARDRSGLIDFLSALRAALPGGRTVTICISGRTSDAGFRAGGYELSRIAPRVNRVEYMTYDEHGPWENTPGPVGALPWQRQCLRALLAFVPRRKVDLGIAGYGYAWRPHANVTLSDRRARKLAGGHAQWVGKVGEWTAHLPDGSTLWWSDARSYRRRADLARHWRLHGLAVWNLQESDPIR